MISTSKCGCSYAYGFLGWVRLTNRVRIMKDARQAIGKVSSVLLRDLGVSLWEAYFIYEDTDCRLADKDVGCSQTCRPFFLPFLSSSSHSDVTRLDVSFYVEHFRCTRSPSCTDLISHLFFGTKDVAFQVIALSRPIRKCNLVKTLHPNSPRFVLTNISVLVQILSVRPLHLVSDIKYCTERLTSPLPNFLVKIPQIATYCASQTDAQGLCHKCYFLWGEAHCV